MKKLINLENGLTEEEKEEHELLDGIDEKFLIVTFYLGNQIYGAKVSEVQEIINYPVITKVPRTVNYLAGILSLRGKIIPIIDLRKKLGMTEKENNIGKRVIISNFDDQMIGIIVDKVSEVIKLSELESSSSASVVSTINEKYIYSVARYTDKIITILNMKNVITVTQEEKEFAERILIEKSRQNYLNFLKGKIS